VTLPFLPDFRGLAEMPFKTDWILFPLFIFQNNGYLGDGIDFSMCVYVTCKLCLYGFRTDSMSLRQKDLKKTWDNSYLNYILIITESVFPVHEFQIYLNICTLCITALSLSASKQCHVRLLFATNSCIQLYSLNSDYFWRTIHPRC